MLFFRPGTTTAERATSPSPNPPLFRPMSPLKNLSANTTAFFKRAVEYGSKPGHSKSPRQDPYTINQFVTDATATEGHRSNGASNASTLVNARPDCVPFESQYGRGTTFVNNKTGVRYIYGPSRMRDKWFYAFKVSLTAVYEYCHLHRSPSTTTYPPTLSDVS